MFAEGQEYQKGAIFGFEESAMKGTPQHVVKISEMNADKTALLDKNVQIHNIGEERDVDMVNYELSIRGKQNLETVSRKLVLKRSADLIQNKSMLSFTMYRKAAKEIEELRLQWSEKMNKLKKKGFDAKDTLDVKVKIKVGPELQKKFVIFTSIKVLHKVSPL